MYSFDSLTLKYFYDENKDFIEGAIVQKIQLPSRYEIILNIRNLKQDKNKKLYININPKYPHICFSNDENLQKRRVIIPKTPPMFCMQLRKYINGSKIKDFKLVKYDRILELYFDYFDEIGSLTRLCLSFEFMGKYSNVILYNSLSKIIIGSIHNISQDKSSIREVYGGIKYIYPPLKSKKDILNSSYSTFFEIAKEGNIKDISNNFYYLSSQLLEKIYTDFSETEKIYEFLQKLASGSLSSYLCDFWGGGDTISESLDNYYSSHMFSHILSSEKQKLKRYLKSDIKKVQNILSCAPKEDSNYKEIADLLMANLYNISSNQKSIILNGININLDENISISDNAQKYYALYKKQKTALEHSKKRLEEASLKSLYYDSILFNIDNAESFSSLDEIKDELAILGLIQKDKNKKDRTKVQKIEFRGYDIYLGKNNIQNDEIISKLSSGEDMWFHALNIPSSHVLLKLPSNKKSPNKEVLEYCARLVKSNSKAKFSGKTSIICTKRKNLKKPPGAYLGYVTYKNETEIVID